MKLYRVTIGETYIDVWAWGEQEARHLGVIEFDCEYDELTVELLP